MKQKILSISKILMVIAAVAITVSYAYAWTGPSQIFPNGNVPAPVNTGNIDQVKNANFGVTKSIFASFDVSANNMVQGLKGVFGCNGWACFLGNTSPASNPNVLSAGTFNAGGLFTGGLSVNQAGKVSIVDGTQGTNKVFTSDASGTGSWADAVVPTATTRDSDELIRYSRSKGNNGAIAYCGNNSSDDANWIVVGGGGDCEYGIRISQPVTSRATPPPNLSPAGVHGDGYIGSDPAIGWQVRCLRPTTAGGGTVGVGGNNDGAGRAEVICMQKTPLVISIGIGAPNGGGVIPPNNGGGSNPTWQNVTYSDGNLGETCTAWLTRNGFAAQYDPNSQQAYNGTMKAVGTMTVNGNPLPIGGQGNCAYKGVVNGTTYCGVGWTDNDFSLSGNIVTSHNQLRPTASCSGPDVNNSTTTNPPRQTTATTQIYR